MERFGAASLERQKVEERWLFHGKVSCGKAKPRSVAGYKGE
jgi:hypothetical protein